MEVQAAMAAWAAVVATFVIERGHADVVFFDFLARFEGGESSEVTGCCVVHYAIHTFLLAGGGVRAVFVFV
jgi:hypothetical protein